MDTKAAGHWPKVVVVVVNYRTALQTVACIRSLQRLSYPNFEVLVVDNDSGDDSVKRLRRELPGCRLLVSDHNGGYSGGNNLGIEQALQMEADYVHLVNPDTVVLNGNYLTELVEFLEGHPRVGLAGPRVHLHSPGRVQNTVLRFPWLWRRLLDWPRHRLLGNRRRSGDKQVFAEVLNGVCILIRAQCLRDVGLLDEKTFAYIEDIDWSYRAGLKGWQIAYLPVDSVLHLQKRTGYERGGTVDLLLKRNTLYFLLKTRHWLQAIGYTAGTLMLGAGLVIGQAVRQQQVRPTIRWLRQLGWSYAGLWTCRWDQVMGAPTLHCQQ